MKKLQAKRIYVGGIRRELGREKGMTLQELNEYAKTHPETDVDVDQKAAAQARELAKINSWVIVEGRVQFHFLPESIKIYIKVNSDIGAERIWKDLQDKVTQKQRNEGVIESFEAMKKRIQERGEEDAQRYLQYYGFDHRDESQYGLILDTTKINAEEAVQKVLDFLKSQSEDL